MSDVDNNTQDTPDQQAEGQQDSGDEQSLNFKRLREQNESLKQQVEQLTGVARVAAFKEAGIDTSSGVGKAIYQLYDGPVDPGKIKEFAAEEYGWEPSKPNPVSPNQQRVNTIMGLGEAPAPNDADAKIAEAEGQGDWVTAQALKDQKLRQIADKKFAY